VIFKTLILTYKYFIMKKLFLTLVAFTCIAGLQAQQLTTATVDSTAKAKIVFETLVHDFSVINVGGDGNCVFKFKNEGTVPLVLSNVQASCGCTTPSWTKDPVKPSETGEIKVHYDTNRLGAFSKSITVTSNAENSPVILRISGEVKPAAPATEAPATTK
jgi:hypothetical protein